MPTSTEFELAATKFDEAADRLYELPSGPEANFGPDVLTGGTLTDDVRRVLDDLVDASRQTAFLSEDRAETCRFRAKECRRQQKLKDDYEAAYTDYEERLRQHNQLVAAGVLDATPPVPPTPPPPPPDWVELE